MTRLIDSAIGLLARIPHALIAVLGRLAIGLMFWNMWRAKVRGLNIFEVSGSTLDQFRSHRLPYIPAETGALALQVAEHVLPALLIIGFATRFSALGLLILTVGMQVFFNPDAYLLHGAWAAILLMLMKYGPGKISLDYLIYRR